MAALGLRRIPQGRVADSFHARLRASLRARGVRLPAKYVWLLLVLALVVLARVLGVDLPEVRELLNLQPPSVDSASHDAAR